MSSILGVEIAHPCLPSDNKQEGIVRHWQNIEPVLNSLRHIIFAGILATIILREALAEYRAGSKPSPTRNYC